MAIWSRLQAFVFGGAIASAGSDAVRPVLEPVRQHAWTKNQLRVLDPNIAARLVAQGAIELGAAEEEAARSGYAPSRVAALVHLAQTAPGVAEALNLYRRKLIGKAELEHSFAKAEIEPAWWPQLEALAGVLLSSAEVANAIQQGHLANQDVLPSPGAVAAPPTGYKQPAAPDGDPPTDIPLTQIPLDGVEQAAGGGTSFEQLQVLANLAGLPPGPELLLTMLNRNILTDEAVDSGIREGHMKTKWLQAFKRMRWAVLSPQEAASARLRTWLTKEQADEIGALHGYTPEQMELMFLNRGRPASPTQMWRGWARKVTGPRGVPVAYEDHAKAIAISDIRPEYAEMLWEIRFNYPSLFQLNRLVEAGTVDAATAATWAEYNLYAPAVVDALKAAWAKAAPAKADKNVVKAQTQLWTTLHRSYIAEEAGDSEAAARFALLGIDAAGQTAILELWAAERSLIRAQLSPSDVRKALREGITNPATGAPWTVADATAALEQRGWDAADANVYLLTA